MSLFKQDLLYLKNGNSEIRKYLLSLHKVHAFPFQKMTLSNERLNLGKIQREPTFQVVLDALALTPCYSAFLITTDVLEVYMHQFWDSIYKYDTFYRFKIDKRKRFKFNLEVFKDIFKICPRMHQPWRTFAALINRSLSGKTTGLDKLRLSRAQIL
ncbi:hypothetical protein Tco_1555029 [Tanacetum coccineum]